MTDPNAVPEGDDQQDLPPVANGVHSPAQPAVDPPPDVPPTVEEAERKNKRAEQNATRRAAGEKRVGFTSHTAAEKWEDELLPYLREKLQLEPAGVRMDVYRVDPPAKGGGPLHCGYFYGSDVEGRAGNGAGAAFIDYLTDNIHLPMKGGAARYKIIFRKVQGGGPLGDGEQVLGTPEEINDVRTAQNAARNRRSQQGYSAPFQPGIAAPPPPPQQPPPPPQWYPPPQAAPAPPPAPPPAAAPGAPPVDRFTQYLMDELNELRRERGQQPIAPPPPPPAAPPPPAPHPITIKDVAEVVNAVLDERDKRAASSEPTRTGVDRGRTLMQDLRDMWALRNGFDKFIGEAAVGMGFGRPHAGPAPGPGPDGSYAGEVVDDAPPGGGVDPGQPDETVPFTVEEIPGSNYHGERVRWVNVKPGRKLEALESLLAWASANPTITQDVAGRVINVVEKVVNATTFDANGEQQPKVEQPDGRGGWSST